MKNSDIIRAWKDQAYRHSLSAAERAALPENPAGAVTLSAEQAASVKGGAAAMVPPTHYPGGICPFTPVKLCRPN
jgi:mersacidin/lichenicidin family type 2 lantibiotic